MTTGKQTRFEVESFTSYDGTDLRYGILRATVDQSNQFPIAFIPGLGGTVKNALDFFERFLPHYGPIYSLDARGFGLNENIAPTPKPGLYNDDMDRFIHHLQQNNIFNDGVPVLFGISLGAVLAVEYLLRYDNPFRGLIMFAPAFSPHPDMFSLSFKFRNYIQVLTKGLKAMTTMPYTIHHVTRDEIRRADPQLQDPLVLPTLYLLLVERLCERAFRNTPRLDIPTAVVMPENDLICDPSAMRRAYERIPNPQKKLFTYADLYHDVMMEPEPDQIRMVDDLSHWISTLAGLAKEKVTS